MKINFCWDDGLESDAILLSFLDVRGWTSTFALSPGRYEDRPVPNHPRDAQYGTLMSRKCLHLYAPHEVCSHGYTHPDFRRLDVRKLEVQLWQSRRMLEDIYVRPVRGLVYPFGRTNQVAIFEAAKVYDFARSLPDNSRQIHPRLPSRHPCDQWPTAHWQTPGLLEWLLEVRPETALIWGHTYEALNSAGWKVLTDLYENLAKEGATFTTMEEILCPR